MQRHCVNFGVLFVKRVAQLLVIFNIEIIKYRHYDPDHFSNGVVGDVIDL